MTYDVVLSALGDPTRRLVFERLRNRPSSVGALAEGLPISRPAVSQHLKILREAGLVADEVHGARRIYRLDLEGLAGLRSWLESLWDEAREAYQAEVQKQIDDRKCT